ncbi:MAG: hypothetical protein AMXMBFR46_19890 [Acidimicrobiia bacterium]
MRRVGAAILVVLAAVLLLLSGYGWWAKRYFLDSDRFSAKADQILELESVQEALAVAITDEISKASGHDLQIARPFIATIVREVVQSGAFQDVFDGSVRRLHRAVVGGRARDAVLNLSESVDRVKRALEPIAPDLADEIPSGKKVRVTVLDKSELQTIYDTTNLVENVVIGLTIATIVLFAAGIALSDRRWRTTALAGWVVLGLFLASLVSLRIGRGVLGGIPDRPEYSSAAQDAYKVITRGLMVQGVVFSILGLLVALGAGWTDRHGGWAGVTGAVGRGSRWVKAQVPTRAAPEPALVAAADGPTGGAAPAAIAAGVSAAPGEGVSGEAAPGEGAPGEGAPGVAAAAPPVRVAAHGVLAPRLPEPPRKARTAHWWRAAGLLVLGLFAILSPASLTTVIIVLLGLVALYLALTEALAAWASPREPAEPDEPEAGDQAAQPDGSEPDGSEPGEPEAPEPVRS